MSGAPGVQQMYHTVRAGSGAWTPWEHVESQVADEPATGFTAGPACAGSTNALHLVAIGEADNQLYYASQGPGGWTPNFVSVPGVPGGGFVEVACAASGNNQLQILGISPAGDLFHAVMGQEFQNVRGPVPNGGPPGFTRVSCGIGLNDVLHVVALGSDYDLYHTMRQTNGTWQNRFGRLADSIGGGPVRFMDVTCAVSDVDLQVVGIAPLDSGWDPNHHLFHSIRDSNGNWQDPYGIVENWAHVPPLPAPEPPGTIPSLLEVAGGGAVGGSLTFHLLAAGGPRWIFHTRRFTNGDWQNPFGLLADAIPGPLPAGFPVTGGLGRFGCACVDEDLHVVGLGYPG